MTDVGVNHYNMFSLRSRLIYLIANKHNIDPVQR